MTTQPTPERIADIRAENLRHREVEKLEGGRDILVPGARAMRDVGTKARWGCYLRTPWFKPYVAGFYAHKYEGREITPQEAVSRMDELLASTPFENVSPDGSIQSAMWKELSL